MTIQKSQDFQSDARGQDDSFLLRHITTGGHRVHLSPLSSPIQNRFSLLSSNIGSPTCYNKRMGRSHDSSSTESAETLRHALMNIRRGLLGLHKALIVAEQLTYERINGRIASTGQLLQLVLNDPWFTWLHPLSQLVIRIDELLDDDHELTTVEVAHFLSDVRALIRPSEKGDGFERSYYEALQRAPDVIFAHAEVKKLLTQAAA